MTTSPQTKLKRKTTTTGLLLLCIALLGACTSTPTKRSTGEAVDDAAITTRAKAALAADPDTDALDIEIETFRGVIQLNGVADSELEIQRASEIAAGIKGVTRVANNLIVRQSRRVGEYLDDNVLIARVNAALVRDPSTSALAIDVEANRGTILLGGFVATETERQRAGEIAAAVSGVLEVRNNLQLKAPLQ